MKKLSLQLLVGLFAGVLCILFGGGCSTRAGIGLEPGKLIDVSRGTFYQNPSMSEDFDYSVLAAPATAKAYRIGIPFAMDFASVAWGNWDLQRIMVVNRLKSIDYADYERICFFGFVECYQIHAYGERRKQNLK